MLAVLRDTFVAGEPFAGYEPGTCVTGPEACKGLHPARAIRSLKPS